MRISSFPSCYVTYTELKEKEKGKENINKQTEEVKTKINKGYELGRD